MINWMKIFNDYGVDYIESGTHVKKGNININCPFCENDTRHFLGIELSTGAYGCWWSKEHRGRSAPRLLMKVLRLPYEKVLDIAGISGSNYDPDGFDDVLQKLKPGNRERSQVSKSLDFYKEFMPAYKAFEAVRYLEQRGFDDVPLVCDEYSLKFSRIGDFSQRIIIPFYQEGQLITWTGRSIGNSALRYRDLELDLSVMPPKGVLFNIDNALTEDVHTLVVVEGQFDVMKLDYYGKEFGVRAVGINTKTLSESQMYALLTIGTAYERVIVMLDTSNRLDVVESMQLTADLSALSNVEFKKVPYGYKDCGELPPGRVKAFCKHL